jgi:uncharacterized protein (TIGR03435 family)
MVRRFGKMFWRISLVAVCLMTGFGGGGAELLAQGAPAATASTNAAPAPAFDVATIKPHAAGARVSWMGVQETPDGLTGSMTTLTMLMQYAYGLRNENQVFGVPDWARADRYDIQAKMSEADVAEIKGLSPAEGKARRQLMLRALLAERFQLKTHPDTKQVPVYELVVAKGATKLKDAATDTNPQLGMGKDGKPWTGIRFMKDTSVAQGYSMSSLADLLSAPFAGVGRPVVDKTGLTGTYDFTINWSVYTAQVVVQNGVATGSAAGDDAPSIFGALKEIGLKLQPATGAIDTVVVDHVEKPTEN